ncbi:hypothetical protein BE04_32655 [Sorangium cellulosum]|uniref:Uncharacterized protein n=1 Tax=Sorangium cellulosum TaxID=56 RepID=A0A150PJJ1_SORCE|nr:hypothetical protein BE04_32655 [Sorangium cellulosum]
MRCGAPDYERRRRFQCLTCLNDARTELLAFGLGGRPLRQRLLGVVELDCGTLELNVTRPDLRQPGQRALYVGEAFSGGLESLFGFKRVGCCLSVRAFERQRIMLRSYGGGLALTSCEVLTGKSERLFGILAHRQRSVA